MSRRGTIIRLPIRFERSITINAYSPRYFFGSCLAHGIGEVSYQVFGVFDADAEAHQVVRHL